MIIESIELVKKGIGLLIKSLKKFKLNSEIIHEIESNVDIIYSEFYENNKYHYICGINEDGLYDLIVEKALHSHCLNIDNEVEEFIKDIISKEQKETILVFSRKISSIVLDAQLKYAAPEIKLLAKKMDKIELLCCASEDKRENEITNITLGLLSTNYRDDRAIAIHSLPNCLDLSKYFVDVTDVEKVNWKMIIEEINKYKNIYIKSNNNYVLKISSNYSVAYLFGALIGKKIANITLDNISGLWDELTYTPVKIDLVFNKSKFKKMKIINIVICIGPTEIYENIKQFLNSDKESILGITYEKRISTNNEFWSLTFTITNYLKEVVTKYKNEEFNIFYRGPVEMMFVLGQCSFDFGKCTIYDFNFNEREITNRKYLKGITY